MNEFGDYIIYVDESGDHSLTEINPEFPRFVLAFCIFPIAEYVEHVVPQVERLKFILEAKLVRSREGKTHGYGLKVYP